MVQGTCCLHYFVGFASGPVRANDVSGNISTFKFWLEFPYKRESRRICSLSRTLQNSFRAVLRISVSGTIICFYLFTSDHLDNSSGNYFDSGVDTVHWEKDSIYFSNWSGKLENSITLRLLLWRWIFSVAGSCTSSGDAGRVDQQMHSSL